MLSSYIIDELIEQEINTDTIQGYGLTFENSLIYYNLELIENPNDFISKHKDKDFESFSLISVDKINTYDIKNGEYGVFFTLSIADILNVLYHKVPYYNSSYLCPEKLEEYNYKNLKIVSLVLKKKVQTLNGFNIGFNNTYVIEDIKLLDNINDFKNQPEKILELYIQDKILVSKYPGDLRIYNEILHKLNNTFDNKFISDLISHNFDFNKYQKYFKRAFNIDLNNL